ncbi:hypothetical protein [Streptomyces sp. 1331.2]|uniref:hypothetical protein n=1 Tax=Streptomyces sp. 1331.2 TaxID=1938835 RepID=UPI000BCB8E1C|nr:hypothetical protein [Streptomyces sp. 1331.2]SOB88952.1 hypothetical protein SAMN06272789_7274 [Streptomyces sp. 1331.2]
MRTRRLALTAAAVAALAATATACGPDDSDAGSTAASPAATVAAPAPATPGSAAPGSAAPGSAAPTKAPADPRSSAPSSPAATDKGGSGQACRANDLVFGAKTESQAGGYILITAKAKPGITCTLPAAHPTIAFGSGGIEATAAEHTTGEPITLSGAKTAYAGVQAKTTKGNQAVQFTDVIIAIGNADPNPAGLPVGPTPVDKPIVTNWHAVAKDAVPGI